MVARACDICEGSQAAMLLPCSELVIVKRYATKVVSTLTKNTPRAHVMPSKLKKIIRN